MSALSLLNEVVCPRSARASARADARDARAYVVQAQAEKRRGAASAAKAPVCASATNLCEPSVRNQRHDRSAQRAALIQRCCVQTPESRAKTGENVPLRRCVIVRLMNLFSAVVRKNGAYVRGRKNANGEPERL